MKDDSPSASRRAPTDISPTRVQRGVRMCLLVPLFALSASAPRGASAFSVCRLPSLRGTPQQASSFSSSAPFARRHTSQAAHPLRCLRAAPLSLSAKDSPPAPAAAKPKEGADAPSSTIYDQEERDRVSSVIDIMMNTPADALQPAPKGSLPPTIYDDNMEWLLNEPVYKSVMYSRLEQCGTEEELEQLEIVDQLLLDIKKKQRDTWNREKLEIIIGAALEGPTLLDEVLSDMRDSRALDDGLVDFLEALTKQAAINKESVAAAKPDPVAKKPKKKGAPDAPEEGEPMLVTMLKIIKDRVIAEIRTRDKPYVRMLAVLLRIDEKEERDALLRSTVLTEEAAEMFENFTLDGIQYMEQHRADWLADERVEKMKGVAREVATFRAKLHKMRAGSPDHGDERPDDGGKAAKADA